MSTIQNEKYPSLYGGHQASIKILLDKHFVLIDISTTMSYVQPVSVFNFFLAFISCQKICFE